MIGGLWWFFIGQALPQSAFDPLFDLSVALMAFLGGFGTLAGPVLGALILEPLQQWIGITFTNGYPSDIVLGVLFLVVILFMPRGLIPTGAESSPGGGPCRPAGASPRPAARHPAGPHRQPAAGPRTGRDAGRGPPTTGTPTTGSPTRLAEHGRRPMTALLRTEA